MSRTRQRGCGFIHRPTRNERAAVLAVSYTASEGGIEYVRVAKQDEWQAAEDRVDKYVQGYIKGQFDRACDWCPMIEQFCADLNSAHNDFDKYNWPEWTPQANSIRWAENLLKKKLAKTDNWTLYPVQRIESRCTQKIAMRL